MAPKHDTGHLWREAIEHALGLEHDPEHTIEELAAMVMTVRELGNRPPPPPPLRLEDTVAGADVAPDVEVTLVLSRARLVDEPGQPAQNRYRVVMVERELREPDKGTPEAAAGQLVPYQHAQSKGYVSKREALAEITKIQPRLERFLATGQLARTMKGMPL